MGEPSESNQPASNNTQEVLSTATEADDNIKKPNSPVSAPASVRDGVESTQEPGATSIQDDSSSESASSVLTESSIDTIRLRTVKSRSIYKAYKEKLRSKSERAKPPAEEHGANLVESLVDYLRVLEDRIDSLETGLNREAPGDQDSDSESLIDAGERQVEVAFKLFHANAHPKDYPNRDFNPSSPHPPSSPPGTFACSYDTQHLIRALYRTHPSIPPKDVPEPGPNPDEIEIVLLSVASDHIASFFASNLEVPPDVLALQSGPGGQCVLRFARPFKPILKYFDSLKDELRKLEQEFG